MTAPVDLPLADTSEMIGLHQVFREALAAAPALVGEVEAGDAARAELVASYYANVLDLLHGHHEGEDELLTPRLLARAPEHADTISRIGNQHAAVLAALGDAEVAVAAWGSDPSVPKRDDAVTALDALEEGLIPHLDQEEREILPIAAEHINVAEWGEMPEHGMKSYRGDKLWLILGLVQEQMSPEQQANMEAHMPPPVLAFWRGPGQAQFTAFITELRG